MATEVGSAAVTIIPSARGFAKALKRDIAKEFADSDLDKLVSEALGNRKPIKLPVRPDIDPSSVPDKLPIRPGRQPKLPVHLDPLVTAFQAEVRKQVADLSRNVNLEIPASAETDGLRSELAAEIAAVESQLTAEIPTEPAGRREYERQLRALVDHAQRRVKTSVKIEVDKASAKAVAKAAEVAADAAGNVLSLLFKNASQAAASMATNLATSISTAVTSGGAMTVATGGLNLLVGALLAVASAAAVAATGFIVLAPIVLVAGGAFGSLFTIVAGGVGTLAVFKLGLSGIGDALSEIGKDGKVSEETLARLAPNARALVKEFEKLKGPLDTLRRFVQDRLLAGMNTQVRDLAAKWLPALKPMLGDLADRFNGFAKGIFAALGKTDFIENIKAAMGGFGDFVDRIGESMGPLIDTFGRLAKASVPFLKELGDMVGGVVEKFSAWIKSADESGKLDQFMKDAAQALRDIWDIGGLVVGIIGDIVEILFPSSKDVSGSFLGGVKGFLQEIKDWLGDPENQQKLQDWIDKLKDAAFAIGDAALTIAGWVDKVQGWMDKITEWKTTLSTAWQEIKDTAQEKWDEIIAFFTGLPDRAATALSELPSKVREKFVEMAGQAGLALGQAIGSWINLVTGLPGRAARAMAALPGQIAGVWNRARPAVETAIGALIAGAIRLVKALPGKARDALGDLSSTLLKAGRALIDGLIKGIKEKVPALEGVLNWVSDKIPDWKGPYDHDKIMLVPAGRAIMGGLVSGISDEVPTLRRQLGDVTDVVAGVSGDLAAASLTGGQLNSSTAPAPAGPVLTFDGDSPDSFMRWLRENVRIFYGGSAQSALGS